MEKQLSAGSTCQPTPLVTLSLPRLLQPHVHGTIGRGPGCHWNGPRRRRWEWEGPCCRRREGARPAPPSVPKQVPRPPLAAGTGAHVATGLWQVAPSGSEQVMPPSAEAGACTRMERRKSTGTAELASVVEREGGARIRPHLLPELKQEVAEWSASAGACFLCWDGAHALCCCSLREGWGFTGGGEAGLRRYRLSEWGGGLAGVGRGLVGVGRMRRMSREANGRTRLLCFLWQKVYTTPRGIHGGLRNPLTIKPGIIHPKL